MKNMTRFAKAAVGSFAVSMALSGVDEPDIYRGHRGGNFVAPKDQPFRQAYEALMVEKTGYTPRWAAE